MCVAILQSTAIHFIILTPQSQWIHRGSSCNRPLLSMHPPIPEIRVPWGVNLTVRRREWIHHNQDRAWEIFSGQGFSNINSVANVRSNDPGRKVRSRPIHWPGRAAFMPRSTLYVTSMKNIISGSVIENAWKKASTSTRAQIAGAARKRRKAK